MGDIDVGYILAMALLVGGVLALGNMCYGMMTQYTTEETVITVYPIYHCTAPFGMIWIEESASGCFIFIVGSYSSSSEITESYNVKAFDGNELFTKFFDATSVRVVPDGGFFLEKIVHNKFNRARGGKVIGTYRPDIKWLIHIPELPRLNQTISMEWTFVGS